ncbi:MAG: polyphosphate kinase 2 family protein [Candidatus Acidiferrales bacterium]
MAKSLSERLAVKAGTRVDLSKIDPADTFGWHKDHKSKKSLEKAGVRLDGLQGILYAGKKKAILAIFQALDAGGKDGTIRHVMSGINPQGCKVTSFKAPTPEDLAHDFLWRVHKAVPERGEIGIFNRSHYEDVLIVRVHNLVPKNIWSRRFDQINRFEALLTENDVKILKFFLHISKNEQKKRFLDRLDDPAKRWKISEADFHERKYWDEYTVAYEDVLSRCSTPAAPWYIIPADKKWFRNLAVSHVTVEALEELRLEFPAPSVDLKKLKLK